jgi:hypothetical protein
MQFHCTIKDTPYHLVYEMHPHVGISNLPILPSVLSNLVNEAQLNKVYCKMSENPSQNTTQLSKLFQDQVAAVADAANADALMTLPPIQIKTRRKRPPEEINTSNRSDTSQERCQGGKTKKRSMH